MRRWAAAAAIIALAVLCAVAPENPRLVERWFSTGVYPRVQQALTPLSNRVPLAVLDLMLPAGIVAVVTTIWRGVQAARASASPWPLLRSGGRLITGAAVIYLLFLMLWGWNYRRVPMTERLLVTDEPPDGSAVAALAAEAGSRLNALHEEAHRVGWRAAPMENTTLRASFAAIQRLLADAPPAQPGRLKRTLFSPFFRWTSTDGMINPFALEVLVNPDLLPFEQPFVAAHEWAHLAGYADEAEASFVGWLTCVRAGPPEQYSAWMYLYWQISGHVPAAERARIAATLAAGPRRDLEAVAERIRRGQQPALRRASRAAYDHYLRANRVEEGSRSYDEVVTLILRAKFDERWTPVRRP